MKNHITRNYRNFSIAVLLASLPFSPINAMEINDATFNASESYAESVVFDLANAQTYSGVVSGDASALTKTGAGTLTLTTNQTFKGATLVSGGAISIDNVSRLASTSGITLSNGGTLAYTAYAATLSPTVTVAANDVGTLEFKTKTTDNLQFQLAGSGKIILAGNSNNSGTEKVSSFLISNASTFTGSVEITGGKLRLTQNMPNVKEFILNGGSIMNNSSMNINNENVKITSTLVLGENGGTIRVGYDNSRLIWTGKITGTGFFGIGGDSGTFCFANSENDFSAGLQIGDVMNGNFNQVTKAELRADNSLGTGLVSFGAGADHSLDLYGFSISTTPIAGLSATRSGVVVKNSKNSVSLLTLSVPEGKSYSYAGKITGKIDLIKNGNGAQILSGSGFTQTGNTTVNAGLLQLTSNAKLAGGLITLENSGTLDLDGLADAGTVAGLAGSSANAILTNSNTETASTLTLNLTNDQTYAGKITGKINLVKNGEGSQTLAGSAITYSGSTTVNAGTLKIDSVSSSSQFFLNGGRLYQVSSLNSAAKSAAYVFDGGTLSVTGNSTDHLSNITIEENGGTINWRGDGTKQLYLTLANGTSATSDSLLMLDGINVSGGNCNCFHLVTNKFTGKIGVSGGKLIAKTKDFTNLSGVVLDGGTLMFNADIDSLKNFTLPIEITENGGTLRGGSYVTYTMKGVVSGSGELGISGDNGPIVFANSQNSFSGGLNIGSDLNIGDENKAIAMLGADNALGSGVVSISHAKASLDLNGFSLTDSPIAGLSSTVSGAILKNSSSQTSVLTLQVPEGKSESYAGQITGKIDLVKTGAGSQTFSNFQSSGNVLISKGTLNFANGTFSLEDSAFTIEKDGILALSDSSLSVASLAMDLESLLFFDLESDSITLATDSFMGEKGEFSLIWDGMNEMLSGNLADYFSMDQYGFLSLVATPSTNVPEPAAWLLLLCGLGIFGLRAQNRTRSA